MNPREVVPDPRQVRVGEGELDGKPALGGAQVHERAVLPPRELLCHRDGEPHAEPRHPLQERFQAGGIRVESGEQVLPPLDLVLGPPGSQRLRQRTPERVEAGVRHLEHATEVGGLGPVEIQIRVRRVPISPVVPLKHAEGHERIEEVPSTARVQPEAPREGSGAKRVLCEFGEYTELYRRQEDLRPPEAQPEVHQPIRCRSIAHVVLRDRTMGAIKVAAPPPRPVPPRITAAFAGT